jgi:dihydroxy-acid dehydratase
VRMENNAEVKTSISGVTIRAVPFQIVGVGTLTDEQKGAIGRIRAAQTRRTVINARRGFALAAVVKERAEPAFEAIDGIQRGTVTAGDVIVVRGLGPKGTPGMGMASAVVFAVLGAGLAGKVAVVTDGQLSGLTNVGITLGEVAPEAASGGPIGLVENGDMISIDVLERRADLEVSEVELAARRARPSKWRSTDERGWLSIYRNLVGPLNKGAVLKS